MKIDELIELKDRLEGSKSQIEYSVLDLREAVCQLIEHLLEDAIIKRLL